jgi:hypothetical protein
MSAAGVFDNRSVVKLEPRRIDIGNEYDVQYWSRALRVSRAALIAAVTAVGPDARAVSRQLGRG